MAQLVTSRKSKSSVFAWGYQHVQRALFRIALPIMFGCVIAFAAWTYAIPTMLWAYHIDRAGHLLQAELDWPEPRQVDSLPHAQSQRVLAQALAHLNVAIEWRPEHAHAYRLKGQMHAARHEWQSAARAFEQAHALAPGNPLPAWEAGLAYEQMWRANMPTTSRESDALVRAPYATSILTAWQAANFDAKQFLAKGTHARQQEQYTQALAWYERAALMGSAEANFYCLYMAGLMHAEAGQWQEAIEAFQAAIADDKAIEVPLGTLYYRIGLIEQTQFGDWNTALKSFDAAIATPRFASTSDRADTYYRRGVIYKYGDQKQMAMQEFRLAIEILPEHYGGLTELGWAYWELDRDLAMAEEILERAIAVNPYGKWPYAALGDAYHAAGRPDDALDMYEKALNCDPADQAILQKIQTLE